MKKRLLTLSAVTLIASTAFVGGAYAATKYALNFNGKNQATTVTMANNKPFVPLADAVKWFGGKMTYDSKTHTYKVTSKDYNPTPVGVKSYPLNIVKTSGPMKLTISKITLNPSYKIDSYETAKKSIILDVTVQNTSTKVIDWYPTDAIIATNTGEQFDGADYADNIDDVFLGGVTKKGRIVLQPKGDITKINSLTFMMDAAYDDDTWDDFGNPLHFTVKFR